MSWQTIVKEKGLDVSVITFSELSERIDAEYYKPMFLVSNALIENKKSKKLSELADVKGGKRLPKGEVFSDEGISYIRAEDVKNGFVEYESSPKISLELHQKLKSYQTKYDDVLITIVGNSIGDVGIVKFDLKKCNLTENCAKLVNLKEINTDYLFSFLLSKYGQRQIEREKVGTSQPKLALVRIRDFNVPIPNEELQKQFGIIITRAKEAMDASVKSYNEAEQMLLKEINLEGYKGTGEAISVRNFSEALADNRFDAEYWQPKYDELLAKLQRADALGEIAIIRRGSLINPDYYSDDGIPYIRGADFSGNELSEDGMAYIKPDFKRSKETIVEEGDIVFPSVGSVGKTAIVTKKYSGAFISNNLGKLKIVSKEYLSQYVQVCLQSFIGQLQLERLQTQTAQPKITDTDMARIKIPFIPNENQQKIVEKIEQSRKLKLEAKELLEKAKRAVEIFVEKDEKEAFAFIRK